MKPSSATLRVDDNPLALAPEAWNALLAASARPTPFMRHEYLQALHDSGSAVEATGWQPLFLSAWQDEQTLIAACPAYLKSHSYGEYVSLCTLSSIDQMTSSLEDGRNKDTGERGAKHHVSLCSWPSEALAGASPARIARR